LWNQPSVPGHTGELPHSTTGKWHRAWCTVTFPLGSTQLPWQPLPWKMDQLWWPYGMDSTVIILNTSEFHIMRSCQGYCVHASRFHQSCCKWMRTC
jgi:hypothetical protein